MNEPPNHYHILGLPRAASPEQIRAAYTKLLKQQHSGRAGHALGTERLQHVQRAYRCLRDPTARAEHDRLLHAREVDHSRTVRRVQRRIRRFDAGRVYGTKGPALGKLRSLAAVSGGMVLLLLAVMH